MYKKIIILIMPLIILLTVVFLSTKNGTILVQEGISKNCTILRVIDGDTVDLLCENNILLRNNRLLGIDAPELGFCMSLEAKQYLQKISKESNIFKVDFYGTDDCINLDCRNEIIIYNKNISINKLLVSDGYAYVWEKYLYRKVNKPDIKNSFSSTIKDFDKYIDIQNNAIKEKKGIWGKCNITLNKTDKGRLYIIK